MTTLESQSTQHLVQFYESDVFLNDEVADYLNAGLWAGDVCIVIAVNSRLAQLERALHHALSRETVNGASRRDGRYLTFDAEALLPQIMVEGWPDQQRFISIVGHIIMQAAAHGRVRVFGEMVALLCAEGRHDAAVQLENMWKALAERLPFSLLCAYRIDQFANAALSLPFQQICASHDAALPTESCRATGDAQQLQRMIASLQQKAQALESEIRRREQTEEILRQRERELSDFLENAVEGLRRIGPDGTILWANKVELELLGYQASEYIGHPMLAFHVDQSVGEEILARQLRGETLLDQPARLRCGNGAIRHVLIHSAPWTVDGRLVSTRCFTRDITDQVQLEQERQRRNLSCQAEQRLRAANDELESRVHERTARLQRSNAQLTAEIVERRHAEQALQQSQQRLRELSQHTEKIVEDERKRIARELHDQLGQNLMALRIDVLMMQAAAARAGANIDSTAASALDNIDSMIRNVRVIINNLRPAVLDLGLAATIEWEAKEFERRHGIRCTVISDRGEFEVDDARALALLRILQESLTNVLRHARADRVEVRLHGEAGKLCLQVADNGVGGYPGCRRKAKAYGLIGIQERVSALGGSLSIETGAGQGLTLTVTLPLPA